MRTVSSIYDLNLAVNNSENEIKLLGECKKAYEAMEKDSFVKGAKGAGRVVAGGILCAVAMPAMILPMGAVGVAIGLNGLGKLIGAKKDEKKYDKANNQLKNIDDNLPQKLNVYYVLNRTKDYLIIKKQTSVR